MMNKVIVKGQYMFVMKSYDDGMDSCEDKLSLNDAMRNYPEAMEELDKVLNEDKESVFSIFKEQIGAIDVSFSMDENYSYMKYVFDHDVTKEEAEKIVEYTEGQYSDGWGEGIEQEELYKETETYTETEENEYGEEYDEYYETEYILTFHLWFPDAKYTYTIE